MTVTLTSITLKSVTVTLTYVNASLCAVIVAVTFNDDTVFLTFVTVTYLIDYLTLNVAFVAVIYTSNLADTLTYVILTLNLTSICQWHFDN